MSSSHNHLLWKLQKVRGMGPRELLFRTREQIQRRRTRRAFQKGGFDWNVAQWSRRLGVVIKEKSAAHLAEQVHEHWLNRQEPPFFMEAEALRESAAIYDQRFPGRREQLLQAAEESASGTVRFFGETFQFPATFNWQADPHTGKPWESCFYTDLAIPFCDGQGSTGAPGDVKYVWELNRHEFLIPCAKAAFLTGETRYAEFALATLIDWQRQNPYLRGVNWAGPLEVAVRAITWLWLYQWLRPTGCLTAETHLSWIQSFYQHGNYLSRNLEVYRSPNNHLVGEAVALYLLGCFFPEFDEARHWQAQAWQHIANEPLRQFYPDGGSTEQSTSYHHYCLGFFLLAICLRQLRMESVPKTMLERIERAFEFSQAMTLPDGTLPRRGDCDDARSIRLGPTPMWDFRNFLGLGSVLFGRRDFRAVAQQPSEELLWLLGKAGVDQFDSLLPESPTAQTQLFASSGYAVARSGWGTDDHLVCLDGGDLGHGIANQAIPVFTHGHADLLHLEMVMDGHPLLVDGGFHNYNLDPRWHGYTRQASAHNTLNFADAHQAQLHVCNHWSHAAEPGAIEIVESESSVCLRGRYRLRRTNGQPLHHQRSVTWERETGRFLIEDCVDGIGEVEVAAWFHFAPGTLEFQGDHQWLITTTHETQATWRLLTDQLNVQTWCGGAEPHEGWLATSYGCKQAAPLLKASGRVTLPAVLQYEVASLRAQQPPRERRAAKSLAGEAS